jgi:hypothetical protein
VAAAAVVIGIVLGVGGASLRATLTPWRIGDLAPEVGEPPADAPRAEVPEARHAFGTVGTGATGSHRFEIRNAGAGPLTLTRGSTSCSCTVSDFETSAGGDSQARKVVPPGERTFVTVQWKGKPPGGPFRQQVTINTDDPRRPEIVFEVEGTVIPTWRAVPDTIVLTGLTASSSQQASTTIFTYGEELPEVARVEVESPQAAQFFTASWSPLSAEELADETAATGGFRVALEIEPGLPLGRLREMLRIEFTMPEEVIAEVPIEGSVGGDLVLVGQGWDSSRQALMLGTVSSRTGLRRRLFLTVKGPHREIVKPRFEEAVPASLNVSIGEGRPIGEGNVIRIPIDLVIPPGSRPVNHICSEQAAAGRIVLATGHPDSPTLTIPVCVVVGP